MTIVYPNPEYTRMMLLGQAPQIYACPRCKAARGDYCISKGGFQNSLVGFHAARRKLVADMSDDDAYAAMVEVDTERRDRQAAAREAGQRQIDEITDGEIRESRARTRAAWVKAGVEAGADFRLRRVAAEGRKPLGPIRGAAPVVDINAARARRLRRSGPPAGGAA